MNSPVCKQITKKLGGKNGMAESDYFDRKKRIPPQTVAIDVEPSEAMTSELTRTV